MTFAHTSVGRTVLRTRNFLRKQLWIWPIIAVVILSIAGYAVSNSINQTMRASLQSELTTLIQVERSMLEKWFKVQEQRALALSANPTIRSLVQQLRAAHEQLNVSTKQSAPNTDQDAQSISIADLRVQIGKAIEENVSANEFTGFIIADKHQKILASDSEDLVGQYVPSFDPLFAKVIEGEAIVSPPYPGVAVLRDSTGRMRTGTPTMLVCAPLRDDNFQIIGVIGFRIRPEKEFTEILQLGRIGETGETYAIDNNGMMLSRSRFDEALILLGLLPDEPDSTSLLKVQIRDPGGDMTNGFRPAVRRAELPLTHAAAAAVSGTSGVNVEGHRDYRGVMCVGAWTWLDKYEMGLITEIDRAEAFRPLTILNWSFYTLYGMLVLSAVAIFIFTVVVARLQHEAQKAAIEAKQLGQYQLDECLGAGAMGVVYKGHHAMLRRPTAIKMLQLDNISEAAISRFEREVQLTCQLNHPNTIAIYDFGRTPEGVFYYAMEFLDGIDLQTLVERYGPQPQDRVVQILLQVCGSLYEAHTLGMVHRDVKPANMMLNRRGGEADVVKVLDFGLVKSLDDRAGESEGRGLSGTPLYMSPEAIQTPDLVDARSDIYAVGAVGYYLLTGEAVFSSLSLTELCQQHIVGVPEPPSKRLGAPVSQGLENAILMCLEKSRTKRPQTARELAKLLEAVPKTGDWDHDQADAWWSQHEREIAKGEASHRLSRHAGQSRSSMSASSQGANKAVRSASAAMPAAQPMGAGANQNSQNTPASSTAGFDRTMVQGD